MIFSEQVSMHRTTLTCLTLGLTAAAAAATAGASAWLTSPGTLLFTAGSTIAGGLSGNLATDLFKLLSRKTADHYLDGRSAIDENHVVVKALRLAHLKALEATLGNFQTARSGEKKSIPTGFADGMRRFLRAEAAIAEGAALAGGPDDDEKQLRSAVLMALPETFDEGLAARRANASDTVRRQALVESVGSLRAALEAAILEEIALRTATKELPALFLSTFRGERASDSWFDLFVRDAAARLKQDTEFHRIWSAEQSAILRAILDAHGATLAAVDERTQRIEANVVEMLALMRSSGAVERAAEHGISEVAVRRIVERLGGGGIAPVDLVPWLENWIDVAQREVGGREDQDEVLATAWRKAERLFKQGRSGASAAFTEELAREKQSEIELVVASRQRQVRLLEEAIRVDELSLEISAAVEKLRMIGEIQGFEEADEIGGFLHDEAEKYEERGHSAGENAALLVAIAAYRAALERRSRGRAPLEWAATAHGLGRSLEKLGARESGTARLEEAVTFHRAALRALTREAEPAVWGEMQNCLGIALLEIGRRESGSEHLKEALVAFGAALEAWPREEAPLGWSAAQDNLANTLQALSAREKSVERLQDAIAAYSAALEERPRELVPLPWARTQNNAEVALMRLYEYCNSEDVLRSAAGAFYAALEERKRQFVPLDWATTQNNLGNALLALGTLHDDTELLGEAVVAYHAALEEQTRERTPRAWADAQSNLAVALMRLGQRENDITLLEDSITANRAALEEKTREREPEAWSEIQGRIDALVRLISDCRSAESLRRTWT